MNEPSWDVFRTQIPNPEDVFEKDVARRLFCHVACVLPSQITCPPNYAGIENVPVQSDEGWVAFQAKHSRNGKQNGQSFEKLLKVIKPIENDEFSLNKIYCFSSGQAPNKTFKNSDGAPEAMTTAQKRVVDKLNEHGVTVEWYYADRILTILEDATDANLMRASQAFFEDLPQPNLDKQTPTVDPQGFRRLRFSERQTAFTGRDGELQQCSEFTNSDQLFSWWMVTGPGFSGKSRLLLEHCHSIQETWNWGWLDADLETFPFSDWIPKRNTFLVIDYAMGREEQLERLFQQLKSATQRDRFVHKIRLIFLERDNTDWLRSIDYAPIIGNWIAENKFQREGLRLTRSPDISALLSEIGSDEVGAENLFEGIVRDLLEREREHRWSDSSEEAQEALLLATASGGFSLSNLANPMRADTEQYLAGLNCAEEVARMIGVPHRPHEYDALEPDVFGELHVLDSMHAAHPLASHSTILFQRACEINPSGLVNFLYRCSQSFSDHPALSVAYSDWSFDKSSQKVFRAVLANGLESPILSQTERLERYTAILAVLETPSGDLFFIERVLFGKILALFPENSLEIVPAEIRLQQPVEIQAVPTQSGTSADDVLSTLLPEEYCSAVVTAWSSLDGQTQTCLLGPHMVEVYHHLIIRSLAPRATGLSEAQQLFEELRAAFETANGRRYCAAIHAFLHLCSNIAATLVQFGYRSPEAMDFADHIRSMANTFRTFSRNEQWMVYDTSQLDRLEMVLTVLVSHSRQRDFQYILDRLEAIRTRGIGIQPDQLKRMELYVQAAVAASHGFRTEDEIASVLVVLERSRGYTAAVGTPEIASAYTMILGNLSRVAGAHNLGLSSMEFLEEAVATACQFPNPSHGIVASVLRELTTHFQNLIRQNDVTTARQTLDMALSLIRTADTVPHGEHQRLYCAALFDAPLRAYLDGNDDLLNEALATARFLATSPSAAWNQMISSVNPLSTYFSEAMRASNSNGIPRAVRCLEILEFYASVDTANDYEQILDIIRSQLDRRSKG